MTRADWKTGWRARKRCTRFCFPPHAAVARRQGGKGARAPEKTGFTPDSTWKRGILRSFWFWRDVRAKAPWLPPLKEGSAPCATPKCDSIHRRAAGVRLYGFRNG